MSITAETKTNATVRDETIDWSGKMILTSPNDTIATSAWTADNGLVVDSSSNTTTTATCTISGGRLGAYCLLTNTITTNGGKTYQDTLIIEIVPT